MDRSNDKLQPYCRTINRNAWFMEGDPIVCSCGSDQIYSNGTRGNNQGVYYRLRCNACGATYKSKAAVTNKAQRKRFIQAD